jgi:hypothetical protein
MWYNTVTQRIQKCAERNGARVLKRQQGKRAFCIIANRHPLTAPQSAQQHRSEGAQ